MIMSGGACIPWQNHNNKKKEIAVAVRYFKTKDGKILVSKRDGSSKNLATRYTEVDKAGKAKAKKTAKKKKEK